MSETNDNNEDAAEQKTYTPEEIKKMRADTIKFYKGEITLLKVEEQYHDLKARIEENKLRELEAIGRYAQFMKPVDNHQPELGDDGFPLEWTEEAKLKWREDNPEDAAKMDEYLAQQAKAAEAAAEEEGEGEEGKKERTLAKD